MPNPLFNLLGNRQAAPSNPISNLGNLMSRFAEFKSTFNGDPKQKVQELLNSGQMSQEQFNQLSRVAQQFQNMMK